MKREILSNNIHLTTELHQNYIVALNYKINNLINIKKMKTTIVTIALCFGLSYANAQHVKEAEVPAAVKAGFTKQFPGITKVDWRKEDANYEAEFDVNKTETSADIDANGNILETETEIETSALPKGVAEYVTKNLGGKKIKETAKITDAKGVVTYEAEVDKADYIFDSNGAFVKKAEKKEEKKK